jgi:Alpha/beta hydrolase family
VTRFVLVHGGWHGAWCWADAVEALRGRGHDAVAVHLPSDEVGAGAAEYARVVADAVAGPSDVVVGHSLAGLALPLVPDLVEVRALVYLAALLPLPGLSWREQLAAGRPMADWFYAEGLPRQRKDDHGRTYWPPDVATELFFHDCAPATAAAAGARLRPQAPTPVAETTPLTAFPQVPSYYVGCRDDRAVSGRWAAAAARERLGVGVTWIPGSHSPFLADPAGFAVTIEQLTARQPHTIQERRRAG